MGGHGWLIRAQPTLCARIANEEIMELKQLPAELGALDCAEGHRDGFEGGHGPGGVRLSKSWYVGSGWRQWKSREMKEVEPLGHATRLPPRAIWNYQPPDRLSLDRLVPGDRWEQ